MASSASRVCCKPAFPTCEFIPPTHRAATTELLGPASSSKANSRPAADTAHIAESDESSDDDSANSDNDEEQSSEPAAKRRRPADMPAAEQQQQQQQQQPKKKAGNKHRPREISSKVRPAAVRKVVAVANKVCPFLLPNKRGAR